MPTALPDFVLPLRDFLAKESPPEVVRDHDERHDPPLALLRRLGELGYLTIGLPERWGGSGDFVDAIHFMEELGRSNLALGHLAGRTIYALQSLIHHGTPEQQARWIPSLAAGETVFAVTMTEPDAGSDAASIRTRGTRDGDDWVVSGEKVYSSSFAYAGVAMVSVRTDPDLPRHRGISTFLIEPTSPGIETQKLETLGDWATGTYRVFLTDVRVPATSLLGELNGGWKVLNGHLVRERLVMAARAVGATQSLLDDTAEYICNRHQFGHPLADFQVLQHKLANIRIELQVARAGLYEVAREEAAGGAAIVDAASVKVFAAEMYLRAANESLQMTGGFGYTRDFPAQRHLRDARIYVVGGGSAEVMRNIIARDLLRGPRERASR